MAQTLHFLELDGVEGESQDKDFQDKINLYSWAWGATNNSSVDPVGTGHGVGVGVVHEINCTKTMCKATPNLFGGCIEGKHFATAKLTTVVVSGESRVKLFEIDMKHAYVSGHNMHASTDTRPLDQFSLKFVEYKMTYTPQSNEGDATGSKEHSWNIQKSATA
jgi:type VI secretion system secreted protein Hcp